MLHIFIHFLLQVKRKDKLTTKICRLCVFKINEFVAFRKICHSTNVRLRIEPSNVMGDESSIDTAKEVDEYSDDPIETADTSFEDLALNDASIDVTIAAKETEVSDHAEM